MQQAATEQRPLPARRRMRQQKGVSADQLGPARGKLMVGQGSIKVEIDAAKVDNILTSSIACEP